jgi:squalene synthase HpnC
MSATAEPRVALVESLPDEDAILDRAAHENFSVASLLLGRRTRAHLRAIYGFARLVDQIGDDVPGDRGALLDALEEDLGRAFAGTPEHPLLRRLAPTIRELHLPAGPFVRLIEANRQDQRVTRYETFAELVDYCHLSANPVGELVLHVFGAATPERIALSDRVCTALQLVEHWQDVGEDYRNGRIYLPGQDLDRFGVQEAELGAPHASEGLRSLLAFEVERARRLLDEGAALAEHLRGRARLAVAGYVGGGRAALQAIAACGFDVLADAPRASRSRRVVATLGALR